MAYIKREVIKIEKLLKFFKNQSSGYLSRFWWAGKPDGQKYFRFWQNLPSRVGKSTVHIICSNWFNVEDPGNKGFPSSISPKIQPRLHISTPFVYLHKTFVPMQQSPVTHCVRLQNVCDKYRQQCIQQFKQLRTRLEETNSAIQHTTD